MEDVRPGNSRRQPGEPRGHRPPRARTRHQPHRNRPRLRHVRNAARPGAAEDSPARNSSCKPRSPPTAMAQEFLRTFDKSMELSRSSITSICSRSTASTTGTAGQTPLPKRLLEAARQLQQDGRCPVHRVFHPRTADIIQEAIEHRRVRLREPPLVFGERPNWPAPWTPPGVATWACSSSARTTRAANSTSRRQSSSTSAQPLSPDGVQRPLLPVAPGGPHASASAPRRPSDFDEHVRRSLDARSGRHAGAADRPPPATEMHQALGGDWCDDWEKGIPEWEQCRATSISGKSSASGTTPSRSTWSSSAKCATTC